MLTHAAGPGRSRPGRASLARAGAAARAAATLRVAARAGRVRALARALGAGRRSSSATTTSAAKACARRTDVGALAVLEVNAPVVDYPGSPKRAARPRAARRADAPLARLAVPDGRPARDADRGDPAGLGPARRGSSRSSGAPTPSGSARARRAACRSRGGRARRSRCSPARSARGTAPSHLVDADARAARSAGGRAVDGGAHRRRPGAARPRGARPRASTASPSPAPSPHDAHAGAAWRPRTSAWRRSTSRRTRRCSSASTGRRSRSSSTWRRACRSSRRRSPRLARHPRGTGARGCSTIRPTPRALADALERG